MIASRSSIERRCSWIEKQSSPVMRWHSTTSGIVARKLRDLVELARVRAHSDDDADREPERARVELGPVAGDHSGRLEPLHPFGDCRRGEADPPPELGHAQPRIVLQLLEQPAVDLVQQAAFVG